MLEQSENESWKILNDLQCKYDISSRYQGGKIAAPEVRLCRKAQAEMFKQHEAPKLAACYIKSYPLLGTAELELFKLPNASSLIKEYIKRWRLGKEAQELLFELPDYEEIIKEFVLSSEPEDLVVSVREYARRCNWL